MQRGMLLLFLALAAFAQTGKQPKPLTNADVVEMWRVGVPESTIILAIQKTPVKFDVSAEGILALHAAGITEPVLNQMLRAAKPPKASFGVATGSFPVKDAAVESPKAKGFYTGCGGNAGCTDYKVGIDDTVSYYGRQSHKNAIRRRRSSPEVVLLNEATAQAGDSFTRVRFTLITCRIKAGGPFINLPASVIRVAEHTENWTSRAIQVCLRVN
jgi:hypothetical protein